MSSSSVIISHVRAAGESRDKQSLRLKRFLSAGAAGGLYLLVLALFYWQGKVDGATLLHACALIGGIVVLFYALFRTNLNLRFADPSLTKGQLLASVFVLLYVYYRAPETRLAFNAFFFVALMFGMLRHTGRELAGLSCVALLSFLFVVLVRHALHGNATVLREDLLLCAVLAVTLPAFLFVGERVKTLRRSLSAVSDRLENIEEEARLDELTGLYNRRALLLAMEEAKRHADANGEALSMCVIDLDLFKRFNDEFDHLAGDAVLRAFALAVQAGLRTTDVFGRYGGEEFVQILRQTSLSGAMADAERLRKRISEIELPIPRKIGPLTVSIGVAQYIPGEEITQTFARADAALYRAKGEGRNRVETLQRSK